MGRQKTELTPALACYSLSVSDPICESHLAAAMQLHLENGSEMKTSAPDTPGQMQSPPPRSSAAAAAVAAVIAASNSSANSSSIGHAAAHLPSYGSSANSVAASSSGLGHSSSISASATAPSESDVLLPIRPGGSDSESGSRSCDDGASSDWLPSKLRPLLRRQRMELVGSLAQPVVQSALVGGFGVAVLFLLFILLHFLRHAI
jgi:hypothetical protein